MLIGLVGLPGNGKGTVAKRLAEAHGFRHMKMADTLKNMLRLFLREYGADDVTVERIIEGDLKELPTDFLNGKSGRWAMQSLGTEWGRDCISPSIWGDIWESKVDKLLDNMKDVVVDDVRFKNEQDRTKAKGGFIVHVHGRFDDASAHPSDNMDWTVPDYSIANTGSLRDLDLEVDNLLKRIRKDVWE